MSIKEGNINDEILNASIVNANSFLMQSDSWKNAKPFPHIIIDNFFTEDVALKLEEEFPDFSDPLWHEYNNPIEIKKVCNNWNLFPKMTYGVFNHLNSYEFTKFLSGALLNNKRVYSDPGLNGGGWHIHKSGGKLNNHLDYSLHPKLSKQRKLNIIVYLNSNWQQTWGGHLGFWGNESKEKPGKLLKTIYPKFNRAVIFDTTKNSWHGLSSLVDCPKDQFRKSLAVYYLITPEASVDNRGKALFAPTNDQKDDRDILDLIKKRSSITDAKNVYKK